MTKRLLAFDQAANLSGWAYFENEKPKEWGVITPLPKSAKGGRRLNSLYSQFEEKILQYKPEIIVYEPPIGDDNEKGHKTLVILSQIMGLIQMLGHKYNIKLEEMPAARWQFNCRIHKRDRTSRKAGACEFINKEYNIPLSQITQDEIDALCIGYSYFIQRDRDEEKECAF